MATANNENRVVIGPAGTPGFDQPQGGDWGPTIRTALQAGWRWLVFNGGSYSIQSTTNLDDFDTPQQVMQLRMEGAGHIVTNLSRGSGFTGPLFRSADTKILHVTGLSFQGQGFAATAPLCDFGRVQLSYFEDCSWNGNGQDGLSLGVLAGGQCFDSVTGQLKSIAPQVDTTTLVGCWFDDNDGNGLNLGNSINVQILGGGAQRNGNIGVYIKAPDAKPEGGLGSMIGFHEELNGPNGNYGLVLDGLTKLWRVQSCYFFLSNVWLTSGTLKNVFEGNHYINSAWTNNGAASNVNREQEHTNNPSTPTCP